MASSLFHDLVKKLISEKISTEEYVRLEKELSALEQEEIEKKLEDIWNQYDSNVFMDIDDKTDMLYNIKHRVLSQKSEKKKLYLNPWYKIAAVILLLFTLSFLFLLFRSNPSTKFVVFTESGQKSQILLPDSTQVWLNSGSRLTYTSDFNKNSRKVQLEGEGYFKVRRNDKSKFEVEAGKIVVTVFGTVFNVSSYSTDSIVEISLESGKVQLRNRIDKTIIAEMRPDQKVLISKNDLSYRIESCDASLAGIWHKNKLKFVDATTKEVFNKMERWYGMNIHVANPDSTIHYGFTLKSESLREMLELINIITPITYRVDGEEVYVRYK